MIPVLQWESPGGAMVIEGCAGKLSEKERTARLKQIEDEM